ncbi:amidohydrolase [Occallatibacter savannae]|uniref:amidohydrolase n=1 Tax=Occallatibacter savannae TaxID=1002691 RepID=UPI000D68EC9A|nr:amidohydrolase [Occallatibacter savannae]
MSNQLFALLILATLPLQIEAVKIPGVPDIVLLNGRVFTGNAQHPYVQAISIRGDRILDTGTNSNILSEAGASTRQINLGGRLVIPGINDGHVHFEADVTGTKLDFGTDPDPACSQVLDTIRKAVAKSPDGTLLSGIIGQRAFFDPECTPAILDRIGGRDPIVLSMDSPHSGMLNEAASQRFHVDEQAPPPLAGFFGKDMKSAHWDGVVHESAWFRIREMLMGDVEGEPDRLRRVLDREARWGVTSITLLDVYPARRVQQLAAIDSPLRIRVVPFLEFQEKDRRREAEYPSVPAGLRDRVTVSGLKYLLDGTPEERSAATRVPYADDPSTSGQIDFSRHEIEAILREAKPRDVQLLLHVIGDRTTETLLDAMDATGGVEAWSQRRLRIEHGDGIMPDQIPRVKKLGIIVVENPTNFTLGGLMRERFGQKKAAVVQAFGSLLRAGIPLAIATDSSPETPVANPYLHIMYASAYPGKPKESISRDQAVIAFTRTAAYAEFAEKNKGTLEPGKLADLAVLSQDIFKIPTDDLPKTESLLTIVGGRVAFAGTPFANSNQIPVK